MCGRFHPNSYRDAHLHGEKGGKFSTIVAETRLIVVLWLDHLGDEDVGYLMIVKEEWPQQGPLISKALLQPIKPNLSPFKDDREGLSFCSGPWLLWGTLNPLGEISLKETNS